MAATGMQTVDLVIAGVGVFAVLATVLGVVFYEEAAGQQTIVFPEREVAQTDSASGSGTLSLSFDVPDNATAFEAMRVTVQFTGTAGVNPSGGSYEVRVTGPDGTSCEGAGAAWSESDVTINVPDCRWADAPETQSADDVSAVDQRMVWDSPLEVEVVITNPDATNVPNVHSYSYNVRADVDVLVYAAQTDIPDPQGAQ